MAEDWTDSRFNVETAPARIITTHVHSHFGVLLFSVKDTIFHLPLRYYFSIQTVTPAWTSLVGPHVIHPQFSPSQATLVPHSTAHSSTSSPQRNNRSVLPTALSL